MSYLAEWMDLIKNEQNIILLEKTNELSKIIRGLIKSLKK
jgi:hypothetical protein